MTSNHSLIAELKNVIGRGSAERRAEILLQIADLFIDGSARFSDEEIGLFDDVISRLAAEIEVSVRVLLAHLLAPLEKAPFNITRTLASDDEIRVAAPLLEQSERLDELTLVEITRTKSQEHLLAISRRKTLCEGVTDILVERGNQHIMLNTAKNSGARFSQAGFSLLVKRSSGDDILTMCVGSRPDIPHHLFLALLGTASEMVRTKLIVENPKSSSEIGRAVAVVADDLRKTARMTSTSYAAAEATVRRLDDSGQLTAQTIQTLAQEEKVVEILLALARICDVPIEIVEDAMVQDKSEAILVLAKAAKLSWSATKVLLSSRMRQRGQPRSNIEHSLATCERLNSETAQRILEFHRMRRTNLSGQCASAETKSTTRRTLAIEHNLLLKARGRLY